MDIPGWFWIPCVMLAAAAQTVRNAAQRSLSKTAGTLAATLVRFVYGLPFALAALAVVLLAGANRGGNRPRDDGSGAALAQG